MKKWIRIFAALLCVPVVIVGAGVSYLHLAFPKVTPAPPITLPKDPARIEHGRYLAEHVAMCIECHSLRDWSRYAGPLQDNHRGAGGERFAGDFGVLYSPNITPTGIGNWSDEQLYTAVAQGVSAHKGSLFPLMPYPTYGKMAREDLEDILAYVRSLKPRDSHGGSSKLNFPLNLIVRTMPADPNHQPAPAKSDTVAYGRYLVSIASCNDCHTPKVRGQEVTGMTLAGGFEFQTPWGPVRSANITPDPATGIGSWTREQFIQRFKDPKQRHNRGEAIVKGKFNTMMPWVSYSGMSEEDLGAMYDYLKTVPPVNNKVNIGDSK